VRELNAQKSVQYGMRLTRATFELLLKGTEANLELAQAEGFTALLLAARLPTYDRVSFFIFYMCVWD